MRNRSFMNAFCAVTARAWSFAATTTAVGMPRPTSSAWLGPDSTMTCSVLSTCAITSLIREHHQLRAAQGQSRVERKDDLLRNLHARQKRLVLARRHDRLHFLLETAP